MSIKEIDKKFKKKFNSREEFLKQMPAGSLCAEVGVRDGRNAKVIYKQTSPSFLYLIDPWETLEDWWGSSSGAKFTDERRKKYYESYLKVYDHFKDNKNVEIMKLHSKEASSKFSDNYFDWVYIDGDHRYEYVLEDLKCWHNKVKNNGYICGHDYCHSDVKKAVKEYLKSQKKSVLLYTSEQQGDNGHSEFLIKVVK